MEVQDIMSDLDSESQRVPPWQATPSQVLGSEGELDFTKDLLGPSAFDGLNALANGGMDAQGHAAVRDIARSRVEAADDEMNKHLTEQDKMIKELIDEGETFELRCAIGQKFSRTDGKGEAYKALKGQVAKQQFREEWLAKQWSQVQEKLEYKKQSMKRYTVKGTLVPFCKIVEREGGPNDPAAVRASMLYGSKALKLGPPWIGYNSMTERVEFLQIEKSQEDIFQEAWCIAKEGLKATPQNAAAAAAIATAPQEAEEAVGESPEKHTRPKEKAKAQAGEKNKGEPVKQDTPSKKPKVVANQGELNKALTQAFRTKAKLASASSTLQAMLLKIPNDASWQWANNQVNVQRGQDLMQEVMQLQEGLFAAELMTSESTKDLKANYKADNFLNQVLTFNECAGKLAVSLEQEVRALKAMHSARTKI